MRCPACKSGIVYEYYNEKDEEDFFIMCDCGAGYSRGDDKESIEELREKMIKHYS